MDVVKNILGPAPEEKELSTVLYPWGDEHTPAKMKKSKKALLKDKEMKKTLGFKTES